MENPVLQPSRRTFLRQASAVLGSAGFPVSLQSAIDNTEPMKIIQIDAVTFR